MLRKEQVTSPKFTRICHRAGIKTQFFNFGIPCLLTSLYVWAPSMYL